MNAVAKSRTKATNVSLDRALVDEAKALGVNISVASAWGLERAVAEARRERWLKDNRAALESSNAYIASNGLPLSKHRLF
jgi:antitoxin CcdA